MASLTNLSSDVRQYLLITGNYWGFTLTDGALRMLVLLHFHALGFSPLAIASLFLFYEFFGVLTNLLGGWLAARFGLNKTMNVGLGLQILALTMLLVPDHYLTIAWVMAAQALSGVAKDLNKMSAKSSVKLLVAGDAHGTLFRWVALLTGSKNTLKGLGFFLGALLLSLLGFKGAIFSMAAALLCLWLFSLFTLRRDLGRTKAKPKFSDVFSKSRAINYLSISRLFLFCARDVWFVVALPVYLTEVFGWDYWWVGAFIALWVVAYGFVQALTPKIVGDGLQVMKNPRMILKWALMLVVTPLAIAFLLGDQLYSQQSLIIGLMVFGGLFAVNSSLHSFLIVGFASKESVSLDIGFYYMANAMGRLVGTVLSGYLYQVGGIEYCLLVSAVCVLIATVFLAILPASQQSVSD